MPAQAKRAAANKAAKSPSRPRLGPLPEWNLADLYAGIDDPAVKRDLDRADAYSMAFEEDYKGKLAALAEGPDASPALAEAVKRYEQLDDLLGRLISYAGLIHAGNTIDPARAKFYGDVQERITAASTHLLFFVLELNRIDDGKLEAAMAGPALGHYRPWLEDIRKDKPYQLEDRIEQLFHEKSVTAYSAWNRLFDETIAGLRFKVGTETLAIEPTLTLLQDPSAAARKAAANALAKTFKANVRLFALVTNTLAKDKEISDRWRGFADVADSRHLTATMRSRRSGSARSGSRIGTATRRCPRSRPAPSAGTRRRQPCSPPMVRSRPRWRRSRRNSSSTTGSTLRCGRARRRAPSLTRPCPRCIPMCCSITRASRAT